MGARNSHRSPDPKSDFAALQERFQRGVLDHDDSVLADILAGPRERRDVLLAVYRHAYRARLVEIVQQDYEYLLAHIGEEAFAELAHAYVEARPSLQPNARWFSHELPEFLQETRPWRDAPELAELAALERALSDAFDAADAPVMTIERLAAIPPTEWGAVRFVPHPSAIRFDVTTNAAEIWVAHKEGREPPAARLLEVPAHLLVWREDLVPKFRILEDEEAMAWDEAVAGLPFGTICEMLAFRADPESAPTRAAVLLQGWIVSGLLKA